MADQHYRKLFDINKLLRVRVQLKIIYLFSLLKYMLWLGPSNFGSEIVGTQKNRLNEHPQHALKEMGKKIYTILRFKFLFSLS